MPSRRLVLILASVLLFGLSLGYQNCSRVRVSEAQIASVESSDPSLPSMPPLPSAPPGTTQGGCLVNTYQACTSGPGTGEQKCNNATGEWGSCLITSCQSDHFLDGSECRPRACDPSSSPVACTVPGGTGWRSCKPNGSGWGDCVPSACGASFELIGNVCHFVGCQAGTQIDCAIYNSGGVQIGYGKATCKADQTGYSPCQLSGCVINYHPESGTCVRDTCQPNVTADCDLPNGKGTWTCNAQGTGYGACILKSCNTGYHSSGGVCVANTPCVKPSPIVPDSTVYQLGYQYDEFIGAKGCSPWYPPDTDPIPSPPQYDANVAVSSCSSGWSHTATCERHRRVCTDTGWSFARAVNTRNVGSCGFFQNPPYICATHTCSSADFPY